MEIAVIVSSLYCEGYTRPQMTSDIHKHRVKDILHTVDIMFKEFDSSRRDRGGNTPYMPFMVSNDGVFSDAWKYE